LKVELERESLRVVLASLGNKITVFAAGRQFDLEYRQFPGGAKAVHRYDDGLFTSAGNGGLVTKAEARRELLALLARGDVRPTSVRE